MTHLHPVTPTFTPNDQHSVRVSDREPDQPYVPEPAYRAAAMACQRAWALSRFGRVW